MNRLQKLWLYIWSTTCRLCWATLEILRECAEHWLDFLCGLTKQAVEYFLVSRERAAKAWREGTPARKLLRERWRIRGYIWKGSWRNFCRKHGQWAREQITHPLFYLYWGTAFICNQWLVSRGSAEIVAAVLALLIPWLIWKLFVHGLSFLLRWGGVL